MKKVIKRFIFGRTRLDRVLFLMAGLYLEVIGFVVLVGIYGLNKGLVGFTLITVAGYFFALFYDPD